MCPWDWVSKLICLQLSVGEQPELVNANELCCSNLPYDGVIIIVVRVKSSDRSFLDFFFSWKSGDELAKGGPRGRVGLHYA